MIKKSIGLLAGMLVTFAVYAAGAQLRAILRLQLNALRRDASPGQR